MDWIPRDLKKSQPEHALSVANFVGAILEDESPLVTGDDGLTVARVVDALYESADSGLLVNIG